MEGRVYLGCGRGGIITAGEEYEGEEKLVGVEVEIKQVARKTCCPRKLV